jgi:hypothetical protein
MMDMAAETAMRKINRDKGVAPETNVWELLHWVNTYFKPNDLAKVHPPRLGLSEREWKTIIESLVLTVKLLAESAAANTRRDLTADDLSIAKDSGYALQLTGNALRNPVINKAIRDMVGKDFPAVVIIDDEGSDLYVRQYSNSKSYRLTYIETGRRSLPVCSVSQTTPTS